MEDGSEAEISKEIGAQRWQHGKEIQEKLSARDTKLGARDTKPGARDTKLSARDTKLSARDTPRKKKSAIRPIRT